MNIVNQLLAPWLVSSKRRFMLLIVSVIAISLIMVTISFTLYRTSGVAQIDMSQSRYQGVRNLTNGDDDSQAFAANGTVDNATVKDFLSQYDGRMNRITPVQNFSNDALSDRTLSLEVATPTTQQAN